MSTHPRRIKQYELQEQLGSGSMAEVWKALDLQLRRHVALKLLHANLQGDPNLVTRFEREARLIASLHHPNIVQVHDFQISPEDTDGTTAYMVMEYIEGQTLARYIDETSRQGNIPHPNVIVQFFTSICLAVHYAHQNGMIHRDLKPANILLDTHNTTNNPVGEPILTDFGIAKLLGVASSTFTSNQLGTPLYISPEQANGYAGNEHSDIYSLGVILYQMATGKLPFQDDDPLAVMALHLNAAPPPPRQINPNLPPAFEQVILRCLAKDPNARFPNVLSLATMIAESLNVPIPERLATPTTAADMIEMPTYLTPSPSQLSSPSLGSPFVNPSLQSNPSAFSLPRAASGAVAVSTLPSATPVLTPSPATTKPPVLDHKLTRPRRGLIFALITLVVLLIAGSLTAFFLFQPSATAVTVGHAFFVSSGQLNDNAQGITDGLQIDLQNIPAPSAGKSYYLWLLGDKKVFLNSSLVPDPPVQPPILLTNNLPVQNNAVHYTYRDPQHNNLLSIVSRLLITLEDAQKTPARPSTDSATWKYYAQLPQELIPGDPTGLRGLDHIRHLYYQETGTDFHKILARTGGLDIWVFRNTEKLLEWSVAARDAFDDTASNYDSMHSQFIRILDYLDGLQNIYRDVPTGTDFLADRAGGLTGLLTIDPTGQTLATAATDPPGDLDHMELHINELIKAPDASPDTRQIAQNITVALNNTKGWLQRVHDDAKKLFVMGPDEMAQPTAQNLLEDLATYSTYAYIGQLDPTTNNVNPGILKAHYDIQKLAAFDITTDVPATL